MFSFTFLKNNIFHFDDDNTTYSCRKIFEINCSKVNPKTFQLTILTKDKR